MSALYVDSIKDKSDTKTLATLSNSAVTLHDDVTFPGPGTGADGGHFLQVKSSSFAGVQTIAVTDGATDITSLSCTMTITAGNKVLIMANANVGTSYDAFGALYITDGSNNVIYANTTAITGVGSSAINSSIAITPSNADNSGDVYLSQNHSFSYLWTPSSGGSKTVKVRGQCTRSTGDNIYINRMHDASNADHHIRGTSSLTIFEVQA